MGSVFFSPRVLTAAALCACALAYALLFPIWDWDLIPYIYLAHTLLGDTPAAAHAAAYAAVAQLPETTQTALLTKEAFRQTVAQNPQSLQQVSAFYADRVGYYGLLAGGISLGLSPLIAIQLLNLLGQCVLALAVAAWVRLRTWGYVLGFGLFLFFPSVMKIARWSNPDGLVAGLFVAVMYGLTHVSKLSARGQAGLVGAGVLAMVVLRPNMVCILLPVAVAFGVLRQPLKATLLAAGVGAGGLVHLLLPGYGLPVLWEHTFTGAFAFPADVTVSFHVASYLYLLAGRMADLHGRDLLLAVMAIGSATGVVWRGNTEQKILTFALLVGLALQFMLFPALWERLILAPVLVCGLLAIQARRA